MQGRYKEMQADIPVSCMHLKARERRGDAREGVGGRVWHGGVAAVADHARVVEAGGGHDSARHGADGARGLARPHVQREDALREAGFKRAALSGLLR